MNISQDVFFVIIEKLHFRDVISLCQTNSLFHKYGITLKTRWKNLIQSRFGFGLKEFELSGIKLQVSNDLPWLHSWSSDIFNDFENTYIEYTQIINKIDKISQAKIYYQMNDEISFKKLDKDHRFSALFLIGIQATNGKSALVDLKKYDIHNLELADGRSYYGPSYYNFYIDFIEMQHKLALLTDKSTDQPIDKSTDQSTNQYILDGETIGKMILDFHYYDNNEGVVKMLLYLISICQKNKNQDNIQTALDCVIRCSCFTNQSSIDLIKYLISLGGDIHLNDDHNFDYLLDDQDLPLIKFFIENGSTDANYLFINNCEFGCLEIVKYLFDLKANNDTVFIRDYEKGLYEACTWGHLDVVKYLVKRGVVISNEDFIAAVDMFRTKTARYLYERGVDTYMDIDIFKEVVCGRKLSMLKFIIEEAQLYTKEDAMIYLEQVKNPKIRKYLTS